MEPYLIVFQFNDLYQMLSATALVLLLASTFYSLKTAKKHREKLDELDEIIKDVKSQSAKKL